MVWGSARARLASVGAALWLSIALTPAIAAEGPTTSRCGWGPVDDVEAVRSVLSEWVASTKLPAFDPNRFNVSIERSSVWVQLQFAEGEVSVTWDLDDECQPTAITVETSAAYKGIRPDESAVRQLVAGFRTIAIEERLQTTSSTYAATYAERRFRFGFPDVAAFLGLGVILVWVLLPLGQRWYSTGRITPSDLIRRLGLVSIVALLPFESVPPGLKDWLDLDWLVLMGILPLMAFLWLALCGVFGYGSPRREDWPALLVFLLALGIREGYARHAIEELEIYFYYGAFPNRHSAVHQLFQMFMQPLASDPYWFMMHVNGVLGALATLPLFLFVRQRTRSRMTAALVATFYAAHPLIVQMTPTDGHYALVLSTWFAGLALLTADEIGARELFGGAVLLGIAATSRAEGGLYLLASLFLIDVGALLAAARRHIGVAVISTCALLGLIAIHVYYCFPGHVPSGHSLPNVGVLTLTNILRAGLFSVDFNDPIFVALVGIGALAGVVDRRMRLGLGAALGTLIVVWPMSMATHWFTALHRLVPACALQVVAAGVGASWITSWLSPLVRHPWAAAIPALTLALYVFAKHADEVRDPNAVTDEFWMLRNHLAPGGVVNSECTLLSVGRSMDTDIHNFEHVLPGMKVIPCEHYDCVRAVSPGGCFYYVRNLNCYFNEIRTPSDCVDRGRTATGDVYACLDPHCGQLEKALELSPVEERTVDFEGVFYDSRERPHWPRQADIGLYKVLGVRHHNEPTNE